MLPIWSHLFYLQVNCAQETDDWQYPLYTSQFEYQLEYTGKWLPAVLGSQILWTNTWGYFSEWDLLLTLFLNSVILIFLWCSSCEFWYLCCQKQRLSWGLLGCYKSERCLYMCVSFYHRSVIDTNEHLCFRFSDHTHPKSKSMHEIASIFYQLGGGR